MPAANTDISVVGAFNPVEGHIIPVPTHREIDEKLRMSVEDREISKETSDIATKELSDASRDDNSDDVIIITGADAAAHLLPLRDDGQPALSFRSIVLATILSGFQAVMYQIYSFKPTSMGHGPTYFLAATNMKLDGENRVDKAHHHCGFELSLSSTMDLGILKNTLFAPSLLHLASNAAATITVFAAQDLFYGIPLSATTVILAVISIGLLGYGICGILRPIMVWHPESVYWSTLPTVKTLQGLHWQDLKHSKPLRYFWYAFGSMFAYEFLPAYIFPWLNSVSIPCLAAMNATGSKAAVLTNLFGGATNNEGMGLFTLSFDLAIFFAYAMFMANAAIGALIAHCFLFWGGDVVRAFKSARNGIYEDPHHAHMAKTYKEAPWWWYISILVGSFILGLIVVLKENITLPVWAYIVSLLLDVLSPLVGSKIRGFDLTEINMAQFIQYSGFIPYNQSQTCVILSQIIAGVFTQAYLRNYRPKIFKDYSYLITGAWDGASYTVLFILSFAVFGAGGFLRTVPQWWGNNINGNYDHCPIAD
ncbi:hypothetical protein DID88_002591 [Monilinia fructigena]|uniref:Uncharacterized protein n=1 Tax=Monilinia fructigena TaxID=38457 RepID=A0A395IP68_9HELO|nr:hypothetical protein DID88_002591 [Monilinia fructigena]